jgi:hypothetical protein
MMRIALYFAVWTCLTGAMFLELPDSVVNHTNPVHHSMELNGGLEYEHLAIYFLIAAASLVPEAISGFVQAIPWCMNNCKFLRRPTYLKVMQLKRPDAVQWLVYSGIWVVILSCKCYFSYYYEIRSAVRNSATTWKAMAEPFEDGDIMREHGSVWDQILYRSIRSDSGGVFLAWFVLIITWVPTLCTFLMDSQIFFSLFQCVCGVIVGLGLRVGTINNWRDLQFRIVKLVREYSHKLDATDTGTLFAAYDKGRRSFVAIKGKTAMPVGPSLFRKQTSSGSEMQASLLGNGGSGSPGAAAEEEAENLLEDDSYRLHFVSAWNTFMDKLRYDDLISDFESSIYKCLRVPGVLVPLLPALLTLDGVKELMEFVNAQTLKFNRMRHNTIKDKTLESIASDPKQKELLTVYQSRQLESQENTEKQQSEAWERMHAKMLSEIAHKESFSGCRDALQQVTQLTMFIICEALGHHQVPLDPPNAPRQRARGHFD